eukprot:4375245-Prymnesium_polylepis.1
MTRHGAGRAKPEYVPDDSNGMPHRVTAASMSAAVWCPFSDPGSKPAGRASYERDLSDFNGAMSGLDLPSEVKIDKELRMGHERPPPPDRPRADGVELRMYHLDGKPFNHLPSGETPRNWTLNRGWLNYVAQANLIDRNKRMVGHGQNGQPPAMLYTSENEDQHAKAERADAEKVAGERAVQRAEAERIVAEQTAMERAAMERAAAEFLAAERA